MQRVISGESGQGNARVIPLVVQQGTPGRITYIRDAGARVRRVLIRVTGLIRIATTGLFQAMQSE